jgi:uncharacterized membrane protein (UPF0127 family)
MTITIGENKISVKLCVTKEAITKGMQGQRFNEDFQGMYFLMPTKGEQSFWMYNCIIPLDIIFINNDEVDTIHENCPICTDELECESYKGYGDKVLELPAGMSKQLGIKKGDIVSFSLF